MFFHYLVLQNLLPSQVRKFFLLCSYDIPISTSHIPFSSSHERLFIISHSCSLDFPFSSFVTMSNTISCSLLLFTYLYCQCYQLWLHSLLFCFVILPLLVFLLPSLATPMAASPLACRFAFLPSQLMSVYFLSSSLTKSITLRVMIITIIIFYSFFF